MRMKPIRAEDVEARKGETIYPKQFASAVAGRTKRRLGDVFGLTNFGINLTHLDPGAVSALIHWHSVQDEFIYVLEGVATVVFGDTEYQLTAGDCIGFKAGTGTGHQVVNRTDERVTFIEVGDRSPGEKGEFSEADLTFKFATNGSLIAMHKDGTPY